MRRRLAGLAVLATIAGLYPLSTYLRAGDSGDPPANRVVLRCRTNQLDPDPVTHAVEEPTEVLQSLCQHRAAILRNRYSSTVQIVVHEPFVILGDDSTDQLTSTYFQLVQPAYRSIQAAYAMQPADRPIVMMLWKDPAQYQRSAVEFTASTRSSIYGLYDPTTCTVVANVASGRGTILHELTHAMLDGDFPGLPLWFQEGLASMHEESTIVVDDSTCQIQPQDNWRWDVLRRSLASGDLPTWQAFVRQAIFRGENEARDYAYARYFCMFLHERGQLSRFYQKWRANAHQDKWGTKLLRQLEVSGQSNSLDADFRQWMELRTVDPTRIMRTGVSS